MPSFKLENITLKVANARLSKTLIKALRHGGYEKQEVAALKAHLTAGMRVLEIGTGLGFIAILAARVTGAQNVVTVEANPAILEEVRNNFKINKVEAVRLLHVAVVATSEQSEVELFVPEGFWAASIHAPQATALPPVIVPAIAFDDLLRQHPAELLVIDAEGAESGFFNGPLPACLHTIILELHPSVYPPKTTKALFDRLSAMGFGYAPHGSNGAVVCFKRFP